MDLIEMIKYAWANLLRRKTRTFLTVLSILVGITTIFVFISFGLGLFSYIEKIAGESSLDKFIVQARGVGAPGLDQTFALDDSDLEVVEKTLGVKHALGFYSGVSEIEHKRQKKFVFISAWDPSTENNEIIEQAFGVSVLPGRQLRDNDLDAVVLGYNYQLPNKLFREPLKVGEKVEVNGKTLSIIGFYERVGNPQDDSNVYVSEAQFKLLFSEKKFAMIFGSVQNKEEISFVVDRIERNVRDNRDLEEGKEDFFVQTYQDLIEQFAAVLNIVIGFIVVIAFISVIVSAVNTANTMVTSVLERTREIGVMKAIGATRGTIRSIFLVESGMVGFIAGLIGVGIGWTIASLFAMALDALGWSFLSPKYSFTLFLSLVLFSTVVGIVSGVTVAIQASLLKPVDALRYE